MLAISSLALLMVVALTQPPLALQWPHSAHTGPHFQPQIQARGAWLASPSLLKVTQTRRQRDLCSSIQRELSPPVSFMRHETLQVTLLRDDGHW